MRYFRYFLLIVTASVLISCGGGGGGSSSERTATISFKLDFESAKMNKSLFDKMGKLTISNTEIASVSLDYQRIGGEAQAVDVSAAVFSGSVVSLSDIVVGAKYIFEVSAFAEGGSADLVCTGSSGEVDITDGVTINLTCSLDDAEDVERMLKDVSELMTSALANPGSITDEMTALSAFVFSGSFTHDGMSREAYLQDLLLGNDDYAFETVSITDVKVVAALDRAGGIKSRAIGDADLSSSDIIITYSNGAKFRIPMNFVFEDGQWKITGNGRRFHGGINVESMMIQNTSGYGDVYTGISLDFMDYGEVVDSIELTGDTVPLSTMVSDAQDIRLSEPKMNTGLGGVDQYYITLKGVIDNTIVMNAGNTVDATVHYNDSSPDDTIVFKFTADGLSPTPGGVGPSLTAEHFPHVYSPTTNNPNLGSAVTINILPPAPTINTYTIVRYELEVSGAYISPVDFSTTDIQMDAFMGPSETSVTLNLIDMLTIAPTTGYIRVTAVDENERGFSSYYRIENGQLIIGNSATRPKIRLTKAMGFGEYNEVHYGDGSSGETGTYRSGLLTGDGMTIALASRFTDYTYALHTDATMPGIVLMTRDIAGNYTAEIARLSLDYLMDGVAHTYGVESIKLISDKSGNLYLLSGTMTDSGSYTVPSVTKLTKTADGYEVGWTYAYYNSNYPEFVPVDIALNDNGATLNLLASNTDWTDGYVISLNAANGTVNTFHQLNNSNGDYTPIAIASNYIASNYYVLGDVTVGGYHAVNLASLDNDAGLISNITVQADNAVALDSIPKQLIVGAGQNIFVHGTMSDGLSTYILRFAQTGAALVYNYSKIFSKVSGNESSLAYDDVTGNLIMGLKFSDNNYYLTVLSNTLNITKSIVENSIVDPDGGNIIAGPHGSTVVPYGHPNGVTSAGQYFFVVPIVDSFGGFGAANYPEEASALVITSYNFGAAAVTLNITEPYDSAYPLEVGNSADPELFLD